MDSIVIAMFGRIGARAKARGLPPGDRRRLALDVKRDASGEWFDLAAGPRVDLRVVDARPRDRHLLLLAWDGAAKLRYLCGHDERHWFVAGVPDDRGVSNVRTALEALQPTRVRVEAARAGVRARDRFARKTVAFVRQGEWFFVPRPDSSHDPALVRRDEPLVRSGPRGGKPHWADEVVRTGGQDGFLGPNGRVAFASEFDAMVRTHGSKALGGMGWRRMRIAPTVFARGRVRHPDHATIRLSGWHEVLMNEEHRAPGNDRILFLD